MTPKRQKKKRISACSIDLEYSYLDRFDPVSY